MLVHGSNLSAKENHKKKYQDTQSKIYLAEIRAKYDLWHQQNMQLIGPGNKTKAEDKQIVQQRVTLFEEYKQFLDQQHYAEHFDSRSNLHSTVLEEFIYYLFKDLVSDFGESALIGKSHAFKDIFFVAPNYSQLLQSPHGKIEKKDHDFVIGVTVKASLETTQPGITETEANLTQQTSESEIVSVPEIHFFDIPVIAIECKTYLDKTMLEGSSRAAEELKARNPNGLYIVVMEWIKLSEDVNLRKYKVDQIYVFRKQKNTDREYRYAEEYIKNPIDVDAVWHLFCTVRSHLTVDWKGGIEHGLQRGWLLD